MTKATEDWVILWFPPDADRNRKFRSEESARAFAATEEVASWNPLMELRRVTTIVETTMVPLDLEQIHGPAWSDWSPDDEHGPSCKCGFNGPLKKCPGYRTTESSSSTQGESV